MYVPPEIDTADAQRDFYDDVDSYDDSIDYDPVTDGDLDSEPPF